MAAFALLCAGLLVLGYASALTVQFPEWRVDLAQRHMHSRVNTLIDYETLRHLNKSQSSEDERLYKKYFCGIQNGSFIEMGALDGVKFSNSYLFEVGLGWRGVLIEASPRLYQNLIINRHNSICINAAVCEDYRDVRFHCRGARWFDNGYPGIYV